MICLRYKIIGVFKIFFNSGHLIVYLYKKTKKPIYKNSVNMIRRYKEKNNYDASFL